MQYLIIIGAIVAFIVGYVLQSFALMVYIHFGVTAFVFLLVVPDWPFYNRHPLQWLEPRPLKSTSTVKEMMKARASKKAGKAKK